MEYITGGKKYLDEIRKMLKTDKRRKAARAKLEQNYKEAKEREKRKYEKNKKRKEDRKKAYDVEVVKEALLQLKKEGLL